MRSPWHGREHRLTFAEDSLIIIGIKNSFHTACTAEALAFFAWKPTGVKKMERVLIFGITKEARDTAAILRRRGRQIVFSVVSEYAKSQLPLGTICHVGRLNGEAMLPFIREINPHRVVDATHPYAMQASQNIRQCCNMLNIAYERVHFKDIDNAWRDAVEWVDTREKLIAAIQREKSNMLLSIGSKPVLPIPAEVDAARLFPRVTPSPEAVSACLAAGFLQQNIIALEGPFSKQLTEALFELKNITSVVMHDVTDKSYLQEVVVPALERGYHVIMFGQK